MKNLLVITLFFFSIGAMAEEKYLCKAYKFCHENLNGCRTENLGIDYLSLLIDEDSFPKKFILNGEERRTEGDNRTLKFEPYKITHTIIDMKNTSWEGKREVVFDKVSKILKTIGSSKKEGYWIENMRTAYTCTAIR